jgi:hypothetical protein
MSQDIVQCHSSVRCVSLASLPPSCDSVTLLLALVNRPSARFGPSRDRAPRKGRRLIPSSAYLRRSSRI